ncbi:MAG: PP2C family protein-serine/threonine phosphatase [Actinomycetota bacterium]
MATTTEAAPPSAALDSLTSALIDANDRLLGLLALITDEAPTSLDNDVLITAIVERAAPILELDHVAVTGAARYSWGEAADDAPGRWSSTHTIPDQGEAEITFFRRSARFDTGDTKLLGAVAKLISNAVTTARMHRAAMDQAMMAKEHATAARITTAALPDPDKVPDVDGVTVFANLVPARNTGGDLYAWREIDGALWFALGDVSGKGLPAAVQMSTITSAIEAGFRQHHHEGPDAVVDAVGRWVHTRLSESGMFVTLAIGHFDPTNRELTVANSGHSPIVFRRDGASERIDATAPPVGVIEGIQVIPTVITTEPGDLLVLATDGFTEQDNADGEMYGEDRFDDTIALAAGDATTVGEMLLAELAEHGKDREQSDDRTLMVLHFS